MPVAGQTRNGFRKKASADLDYASLGVKVDLTLWHFIRLDSKVYARSRSHEKTRWTSRNRVDLFLSRKIGISVKYDRFQDKYEGTTLLYAGPAFVF
jgi:hypothetical protein